MPRGRLELILASSSPRRRQILSDLGFRFRIRNPEVEELEAGALPPEALAVENALRKAHDVASRETGSGTRDRVRKVVLGVDTIVVRGKTVLSKPRNRQEARQMLNELNGQKHQVQSGLCLLLGDEAVTRLATTEVELAPMRPREIDWYLARGEYVDKAGAYGIQGTASLFVRRIDGCYFNVVGLPVRTLYEALAELGVEPLTLVGRAGGNRR